MNNNISICKADGTETVNLETDGYLLLYIDPETGRIFSTGDIDAWAALGPFIMKGIMNKFGGRDK